MVNKYNLLKKELSLHKSELSNLKNIVSINCSLQNKVTRVNLENESLKDEIFDLKRVIEKWTCSKVTLDQLLSEQIPDNIFKSLRGKGRRKENNPSKEVMFTKADVSTSESALMITSDSEDDSDIQEPLPPLPKLTRADPSSASKSLISLPGLTVSMTDLILNTASKEMKKSSNKVSQTYVIKKRIESKHPAVQNSCLDKNALPSIEQLLLTLMEEVKGIKKQILIPSNTSSSVSRACSSKTPKQKGTIFNQNDEVVLIALRRRYVYIIDMSSFNKESNACFLAKSSPRVNWLWHKRLSYLNFKNINNLAKHNLVSGLPSLAFSKDKNYLACEKGKHHRASLKTKRSFSINKSLYLLHMDLFGPVKPQTISHNKYTLVIVDEYSRYTWVFYLKKKSDVDDCIMSFIRKMENLNEVRVKELRSAMFTFTITWTTWESLMKRLIMDYSPVAKAFRVFNIRRQEMKEIVHVTFSEDDEAISQTSMEGVLPTLQNFVTSEDPSEFIIVDDLAAIHKPDHVELADILESAEPQDNVLSESTSDDQPALVISPFAKVILQNPAPQDR
ncbi:retrovirus-related pol polyprotein from transposon TNT 1-94 [Tanacetum coccineum]